MIMGNASLNVFVIVVLTILDFVIFYLTDPSDITLRTESFEARRRKRIIGLLLFASVIVVTIIISVNIKTS